jgi:IS30 family transposase
MATVVGLHKATISRELRRNRGLRGYRPHQAHRLAQARQEPKRRTRVAPTTWQQVEALVREAWSPEQIHGRLQREHGQTISHEWMYQYISIRINRRGAISTAPCGVRKRGGSAMAAIVAGARSPSLDC